MAKKSSSGKSYAEPNRTPNYKFIKGDTLIKVYYNAFKAVEVYQTFKEHTQRVLMNQNDYENFENRVLTSGFKRV